MSKNLNRKGLAFGALVAMTASLIAGTPALAATDANLNTATYTGTGTTVIEGTDFVFSTSKSSAFDYVAVESAFAGTFRSTDIERYNVVTCEAIAVAEDDYCTAWGQSGTVERADGLDRAAVSGEDSREGHVIYQNGTQNNVLLNAEEAQVGDYYLIDADGLDNYVATSALNWDISETTVERTDSGNSTATFAVKSAGITADTTVTLTPYVTVAGDVTPTLAEAVVSGTPKSVTFLNNTGTLLTAVLAGTRTSTTNSNLKTTVTGPAGSNMTQMIDNLEVVVSRSATINFDEDLINADKNVAETAPVNVSTGYYTARVWNFANNTAFSALTAETIVGQISVDETITDIEFVDVANANITQNREVRAGTKTFDISAQIYTEDGSDDGAGYDAYAKAGVSVEYSARLDGSQAAGSEIKINGTVITSAGVKVTVPTDSKGLATVTITSKDGADADSIIVSAVPVNRFGGIIAECVDNWYWNTAYADNIWETHNVGRSGPVLGTLRNSQVTLNYEVTDQFGQPWSRAGYEYQIHLFDDEDSETEINVTAPLVNGKASVTFTNQDLPGVQYTVVAELDERAVDVLSATWDNDIIYSPETEIVVNHIGTTGGVSVELDQRTALDIAHADFFTYNFNLADTDNTLFDDSLVGGHVNDGTVNDIQGRVVDSNNVPLAGVAVTVSAAGVQFSDCEEIYTVGSITVYTDETGFYEIEFFSNKAGDNLFTVTSGGKSATLNVTLNNPTNLHATDVLTVNVPAAVQAGTVTPVRVQLVDKYGNGITGAAIALGLVGEGYLSSYTATTDKGAASVALINGVNDTSKAYISAATAHSTAVNRYYVFDEMANGYVWATSNDGANWSLANKSFTQAVTTGSYATVKASSVKGRLNVVVDNSRNETVRVFVDGKLAKKVVANSNKFTVKVNGLKKGKHKVTVTSDYQNLVTKAPVTIK